MDKSKKEFTEFQKEVFLLANKYKINLLALVEESPECHYLIRRIDDNDCTFDFMDLCESVCFMFSEGGMEE